MIKMDLSEQVMQKIRIGRVKITPKTYFQVEKILLGLLLVVSVILSVLFINFTIYILSQNGATEFLEFGYEGLAAFFENTPYGFVVWTLIFLALAYWVYKKFDISYQRPAYSFTIVLLVISLGGGVGLASSGINENLEDPLIDSNIPIVNHAYSLARVKNLKSNKGLIVKIEQVGSETILAKTPQGKMIMIKINNNQNSNGQSISEKIVSASTNQASFGNADLELQFSKMMQRHWAMIVQLNKIQSRHLERISKMQFQKGQVLKLVGKSQGDSFQTSNLKPVKRQYNFSATEEN